MFKFVNEDLFFSSDYLENCVLNKYFYLSPYDGEIGFCGDKWGGQGQETTCRILSV